MDDIKDHPTHWFLKQVEDFRRNTLYPSPKDPLYDEKRSQYALLAAKLLHSAKDYGRSDSPSWTLAKDVPDDTLQDLIDIIDKAPEIHASFVIHIDQIHIFYVASIGSHYPEINIKDLLISEFKLLSNCDRRLYLRLFHNYMGKITINKKDDILPLQYSFAVDHDAMLKCCDPPASCPAPHFARALRTGPAAFLPDEKLES